MNYNDIYEQILKKRSFLCVGLDSNIDLIPKHLLKEEYPLFEFNKQIIDATARFAIAYKPNTAFYEACGMAGWKQLEMTVDYIKTNFPEILVIADAKRGDIGNTATQYAKAFFETMNCDAVTLSPYMGEDSIRPFLKYQDKWSIVLALTSNKSAIDFELKNALYERVMTKVMSWGDINNTMFVVGATKAEKIRDIRIICPDHFLLVPGVGAQGGTIEDVAQYGLNSHCGLIVNSSRGIIYADSSEHFAEAAAEAAADLAQQMSIVL